MPSYDGAGAMASGFGMQVHGVVCRLGMRLVELKPIDDIALIKRKKERGPRIESLRCKL
jgi:hypothetical protein